MLAGEIAQNHFDGVISADRLNGFLRVHHGFISAKPQDVNQSLAHQPRREFSTRLVDMFVGWCLSSSSVGLRQFADIAMKMLLPHGYEIEMEEFLGPLSESGLLETIGTGDLLSDRFSASQVQLFLRVCQQHGIGGEVLVGWGKYPSIEAKTVLSPPELLNDSSTETIWSGVEDRDEAFLRARWERGLTHEQLGQDVGLTRARIQQVVSRALTRLHSRSRVLWQNYQLFKALKDLRPSYRLVDPQDLNRSLSGFLDLELTSGSLQRVLRELFCVRIEEISEDLWSLGFGDSPMVTLPFIRRWLREPEIPRREFFRTCIEENEEGLSRSESQTLLELASFVHSQLRERRTRRIWRPGASAIPPRQTTPVTDQIEPVQDVIDHLFGGIAVQPDIGCAARAAAAVSHRLEHLPEPHSLCELKMGEEDYQWILDWLQQVAPAQLQHALTHTWRRIDVGGTSSFTYQEAVGLLFMLAFCEVGRREASEGTIWPAVVGLMSVDLRARFFPGGQPSALLKEALQASARRFGLRHVFGRDGTQAYYISIHLQFGFTKHGIAHLPHWLAGRPVPDAVEYLQSGDLASPAFLLLWEGLRRFRRGGIDELEVRQILTNNPFVLSAAVDSICQVAREKPWLEEALEQEPTGGPRDRQIVQSLRFQWSPPGEPELLGNLDVSATLALTEPEASLEVTNLASNSPIVSGTDGVMVRLPWDVEVCRLRIINAHGETLGGQELTVTDENELGIGVFRSKGGRQIHGWDDAMNPTSGYLLLTDPDLTPWPESMCQWRLSAGGKKKVIYLSPGWTPQFELRLEGERFWKPRLSDEDEQIEGVSTRKIRVQLDGQSTVAIGGSFRIELTGADDPSRALRLRIGAMSHFFSRDGNRTVSGSIVMTPTLARAASRGLRASIQLTAGVGTVWITRSLTPRVVGAAIRTDGEWHPLGNQDALTTEMGLRGTCEVFLPPQLALDRAELCVLEGDSIIRKLWRGSRRIGSLNGYGAPLIVRRPYNALADHPPFKIAVSVVDPGVVTELSSDETGRYFELVHAIDLSDEHDIVVLNSSSSVMHLSPSQLRTEDGRRWYLPSAIDNIEAVGVAFRGQRIGAQWDVVPGIEIGQTAVTDHLAPFLRWAKLPVLGAWSRLCEDLIEVDPSHVFYAWIAPEGSGADLPGGLRLPELSEAWYAVVRAAFWDWIPSEPDAARVYAAFKSVEPDGQAAPILSLLAKVNPILCARLLAVWLEAGVVSAEEVVSAVRQLCGLAPDAPFQEAAIAGDRLKDMAASEMRVDVAFVTSMISRALEFHRDNVISAMHRQSLLTCLDVGPFRESLFVQLVVEMV